MPGEDDERDDASGVDPLESDETGPERAPAEPEPVLSPLDIAEPSADTGAITPLETQLPTTDEEAAAAVLSGPTPAQSALPLPVPAPANTTAETARESPALPLNPTGASSPAPARKPRMRRVVLWVAGGILAAVVLVGLFFLGQRLTGGAVPAAAPTPTQTRTATPTPTPSPTLTPVVGPQAPGVHAWDRLGGGECLQPFVSPWEEEFTVVDCAIPHAAQLVYRGAFPGEPATAFPGEAALASQINVLCSAPGVIDLAAARAFPDVQLQGSFPVTEEQWASGQRSYYCFVNRSGSEPLTASIAGPGPAPAG